MKIMLSTNISICEDVFMAFPGGQKKKRDFQSISFVNP